MSNIQFPAQAGKGLLILIFLLALWRPLCASSPGSRTAAAERLEEQLQLLIPDSEAGHATARAYALEQLQSFFDVLQAANISRRPVDKAVELVRQQAEARFFRQPHTFAGFPELFRSGAFSTANTVALFALTFEYFGIGYAIQSDRWSLHVVADPAGKAIDASPTPKAGRRAQHIEEDFIRNYLELLRASHLLPEEEWARPERELFDRYYLPANDRMSLAQLAGFMHYQQALANYRERKYMDCIDWLERAQRQGAQPAYAVLRRAALLQLATQPRADEQQSLGHLFQLWRETPLDWLGLELLNRMDARLDRELENHPIAPDLVAIAAPFLQHFRGMPEWERQVREVCFLKLARHHARYARMDDMMSCLDTLYRMRPRDKAVQDVLAGMMVWSLRHEHNYAQGMKTAAQYREKYPFLIEHEWFKDLDLQYRAEQIRACFDSNQAPQGRIYLAEFQSLAAQYGKTPRIASWVTTAYAPASYHYFLNKDYATARQLMEEANRLAPGDPYLEDRVALMRRYP